MNKVVVIGSLNMDIVLALTRLPKRGETLAVKDEFHNFGGKGANQAVAAARQGAQVAFIGAVGNDENGAAFQKLLAEENIDTKHVTVKQNITGSATILLEEDGHNTILVHGGANLALTAADVRAAEDVLAAADVVIAQLEVPAEAVAAGFKIAREHGALTILNPAPVTAQVTPDVLAYTDVIVPNETEAAALIDAEPTTDVATLEKTVYPAFSQQGLENVIVTLGADGVYYHVQNQQGHVPIFEAKVVDTTAAGDTFIGTLAANVTPDLANIDTILQRSSMASAIAVSRHGAIVSIPTKKEVDAALATDEKNDAR